MYLRKTLLEPTAEISLFLHPGLKMLRFVFASMELTVPTMSTSMDKRSVTRKAQETRPNLISQNTSTVEKM